MCSAPSTAGPKYRRKVLTGEIAERLKAIIAEVAAELDSEILELEVMPDHVHILCEVPPHEGIAKFVRFCKGRSSRILRQEFPALKWRIPTLWTHSTFISTVGGAPLSMVKQYIQQQKRSEPKKPNGRNPMPDTLRKAQKYRLYPTKAQAAKMARTLETCRHVYNSLVNDRKCQYECQYEVSGKAPTWLEQKRAITSWKPNHPELSDVHSQVLQDVSKRVDLAFQAFFRRVKDGETPGYPRIKPRIKGDGYDSFTYPQHENGFSFHQGRLRLSKIGDLAIRLHRPFDGDIKTCFDGDIKTCTVRRINKTCTVRRINGKWFACFSVEYTPEHLPHSDEEVGIDVGLKTFASLSNGEFIENPRFFRKDEKALAKAQRKLAKQTRGSRERRKARKVVSRVHERIRNRRHDFVHQTARRLVNRFGVIAVEKLNVKGMVKNHCLAKSISDASWSMFRSVLTTKAESAGRLVVAVNPAYTSQTCSGCGDIQKKSLSVRTHRCSVCGLILDRDTNAAVNIAAVGQYSLATRVA